MASSLVSRLCSIVGGFPLLLVIGSAHAGEGKLGAQVIRNVVRTHMAQVRICYEKALQAKPNLAGRVTVQWTIEPAGTVTRARVKESTLHDETAEQCIVTAVSGWTFAKSTGDPVNVTYPFMFQSAGDGQSPDHATDQPEKSPEKSGAKGSAKGDPLSAH